MKIDWKKKLTSRKFWAAIIGFVTPLLLGFGMSEAMVDQTTSIIMAGGVLVAYILGESWTDAANTDNNVLCFSQTNIRPFSAGCAHRGAYNGDRRCVGTDGTQNICVGRGVPTAFAALHNLYLCKQILGGRSWRSKRSGCARRTECARR